MDIGKQQRVIIVELEELEAKQPKMSVEAEVAESSKGAVGEWPLPFDMYTEPAG